jgi:hypothetical protein
MPVTIHIPGELIHFRRKIYRNGDCPACHGHGTVDLNGFEYHCINCGGSGKIKVDPPLVEIQSGVISRVEVCIRETDPNRRQPIAPYVLENATEDVSYFVWMPNDECTLQVPHGNIVDPDNPPND